MAAIEGILFRVIAALHRRNESEIGSMAYVYQCVSHPDGQYLKWLPSEDLTIIREITITL
jgi:hypothetical protein